MCLDLNAVELNELGLLERARLFASLKKQPGVRRIKNATRHTSIAQSLPKGQLLKLCEQDGVQWKQYNLAGLTEIKDRITLAYYIHH